MISRELKVYTVIGTEPVTYWRIKMPKDKGGKNIKKPKKVQPKAQPKAEVPKEPPAKPVKK